MIKVKNLNKTFNKNKSNEIKVINDLTFELPDKGLISFLGQSGAGKTTLLNVIGGLDKAEGVISYDDLTIQKYQAKVLDNYRKVNFGYIFQNYNLLLEETVYDNLKIALEIIDIYDSDEQNARIKYALEKVGMWKYRKKKAANLSGGQQQRVSIARALIKNSKVIIADEPTGNLDSENSLMIMQILKALSKDRLILMVTHNQELANFFSDEILVLKDGKIKERMEGNLEAGLKGYNKNVIYLKDYKRETLLGDTLTLNYYGKKASKKIELEIYEVNGNYYLKSDVTLKPLEESGLKVIDAHEEAVIKHQDLEEFSYDDRFFKNEKGKHQAFNSFKTEVKSSLNGFKNLKRKTKFLYLSFVLIGILLAFSMISLSNFSKLDKNAFESDKNYDVLVEDADYGSVEKAEYLKEMLNKNYIKNLNLLSYQDLNFFKQLNFNEKIELELTTATLAYVDELNTKELIKGNKVSKANEVVISKGLAEKILKSSYNYFQDYDSLLNVTFYDKNNKPLVLVGITNNPLKMAYLDQEHYFNLYYGSNKVYDDKVFSFRSYEVEKKANSYQIIKGEDLSVNSGYNEVLINEKYPNALNLIGKEININDSYYLVKGVYKMEGINNYLNEFIINSEAIFKESEVKNNALEYQNIKLVEGRMPQKLNEVVVSIYEKDNFKNDKYQVVGYYNGNLDSLSMKYLRLKDEVILTESSGNKLLFETLNKEGFKENLKSKFSLENHYDYLYHSALKDQKVQLSIFGTFALSLLIFLTVFIYFLMKSKILSDIYNIGVLRSLGAKKSKIYLKYLIEIILTTTLTSAIGYLVVMILYSFAAGEINGLMNELGQSFSLKSSFFYSLLGFILLYLMNIIFGLLPIIRINKKTPSEIINSYDI